MIKSGSSTKFSLYELLPLISLSHEINQFCSKHTLQEVYIDLFHTVDDRLQSALQESCDRWAPGIEM